LPLLGAAFCYLVIFLGGSKPQAWQGETMQTADNQGLQWLRRIRDGLVPFVRKCLEEIDPNTKEPWWTEVDRKRTAKGLTELSRDPSTWAPDDMFRTMQLNWFAFAFKTRLRFAPKKLGRPPDMTAQGFVNQLYELRNPIAHIQDISEDDLLDFIRAAELLLFSAHADEASQSFKQIRLEHRNNTTTIEPPSSPQTVDSAAGEAVVANVESDTASNLPDFPLMTEANSLLTLHRIQSADDIDFEDFLDLMKKEFPDPDVRDPDEDLEMWLRESDIAISRDIPCHDLFLIAKDVEYKMVVALLYGSYFPSLGFLFISYLAVDRQLVKEIHTSGNVVLSKAITKNATASLLRTVSRLKWYKGVVTEIAHDGKEEELKRLFLGYGRRILGGKIHAYPVDTQRY
jgi:hypothetical protein